MIKREFSVYMSSYKEACEWLFNLHRFGIKLGLDQTRQLVDLCGVDDAKLRFIHIAGTNGKGSTGAMLERCLRANGFKTGFYSSPHLVTACERIRIDGEAVSEKDFLAAVDVVAKAVEVMRSRDMLITYFEAITAMALWIFQKHKCDYIVWETGMGGRLDATNIVQPEISVITNIALDHEKFLGSDLPSIASEKAGIVKANTPVVTGFMELEAEEVIRKKAVELAAPYFRAAEVAPLDEDFPAEIAANHQKFVCKNEIIELQLNGLMQRRNAQLVIAVLSVLGFWNKTSQQALAKTRWPGRIEFLRNGCFLLDGGHNPHGLQSLADTLKALYPGKKFDWIFGAFADKDFAGGLEIIAPLAKSLTAAGFAEESRLSAAPEEICRVAAELGINDCRQTDDLKKYLEQVCSNHKAGDLPTVIAGSLYLAGEVLEAIAPADHVSAL